MSRRAAGQAWRWLLSLLLGARIEGEAAAASPTHGAQLDLALYAQILQAHTRDVSDLAGVRVDYRTIADSSEWRALVSGLARSQPVVLQTRPEQLAFWINVYNIFAIEMVARHYPVASIRDVPGGLLAFIQPVWKRTAGKVAGEELSLDQIEHQILRMLGEPRIHAAIVCASLSCPPLSRTPYSAAELDSQLDVATRRWLASREKGIRIEREQARVWLSPIFSWFERDFEASGGALAFATRFVDAESAAWLRAHLEDVRIDYFEYDWRLNDGSSGSAP